MKKFLVCMMAAVCAVFAWAEDIQVRVSVEAENNTFKLKKDLETVAKKSAIKKYILKLNSQTPEKLLAEACNEYSIFVEGIKRLSDNWSQIDRNHGQLVGEFVVSLEADKINSWLKEKGFSHQAAISLVVMEEPPSLGQIKVDKAFGNDIDGKRFFIQNYTTFQRRVRDAIVKKVGAFGFDVKLLADDDQYAEYKSKDGTLVGVYFDVNKNEPVINRGLLQAVKANNPDTIVLYYRIDALIYEPSLRNVRATVAFNMKDLNTGVTKSVGAQSFLVKSQSTGKDGVMDDLAYCVESAMNALMNSEGAGQRLNSIAMSIKNAQNMPKGPLRLIVNGAAFEKKNQKRVLYTLKRELIARKITSASKIKSSNTTLTAVIDNPNIKETDALYMEYISPIFSRMGEMYSM